MSALENAPVKRPRTRRGYAIELGCWVSLWVVNLCQMAARFHTMSFMTAASAVMCLVFGPVFIWQALEGSRKVTR